MKHSEFGRIRTDNFGNEQRLRDHDGQIPGGGFLRELHQRNHLRSVRGLTTEDGRDVLFTIVTLHLDQLATMDATADLRVGETCLSISISERYRKRLGNGVDRKLDQRSRDFGFCDGMLVTARKL